MAHHKLRKKFRCLANPTNAFGGRPLRFEPLEDRRLLAVFSVDNLDDGGTGSLRDAISMANSTAGADEIQFSVSGTINIDSQLPTITDALTITGPGASLLTIDAGNGADNTFASGDGYRIFDIEDSNSNTQIDIVLSGLTLTGGDTANGADGSPGDNGGAVRTRENLTLIDSAITGNAAGKGGDATGFGGPYGYYPAYGGHGGYGGGIFSTNANLTVTGSSISGNQAGTGGTSGYGGIGGSGGGIFFESFASSPNSLTVTGSIISGNTTGTAGDSIFSGIPEYGGKGGGIHSDMRSNPGILTVTDSSISGNTTSGYNATGGGIYSNSSNLTLTGSTISNNSTTGGGGGIFNAKGFIDIQASTITENTAPIGSGSGIGIRNRTNTNAELSGSIIAGNTNDDLAVISGTVNRFISNGYNLIGSGDDFDSGNQNALDPFTADATNLTGVDPLLGPLADNGGPTLTHAPLAGSPAIDAGDPSFTTPPDFDQRGAPFVRIFGGRVDIGAIELQTPIGNSLPQVDSFSALDVGAAEAGLTSYSFTITCSDDSAIDVGTIDVNDVTVNGPSGFLTLLSATPDIGTNGTPRTVVYVVEAAGSTWDASDNGSYEVEVGAGQVGDEGVPQLFVADGILGMFEVNIPSADFDTDGDIDGFDFLSWQRGFGTPMPDATKQIGDADNDTDVDANDLAVWVSAFGTSTSSVVVSAAASAMQIPLEGQAADVDTTQAELIRGRAKLIDAAIAVAWTGDTKQEKETLVDEVATSAEAAYAREDVLELSMASIVIERNSLDLSRLADRYDGDEIEFLFDELLWNSLDGSYFPRAFY